MFSKSEIKKHIPPLRLMRQITVSDEGSTKEKNRVEIEKARDILNNAESNGLLDEKKADIIHRQIDYLTLDKHSEEMPIKLKFILERTFFGVSHKGILYSHEERIIKLNFILNNPDEVLKKSSLENFIDEEKTLLNSMKPPAFRSRALDVAKINLKTIEVEIPEKLVL